MPASPCCSLSRALASLELAHAVPVRAVEREPAERGVQLHLRRHVADLLGQRQGVRVGGLRLLVVGLGHLQVLAQREQCEDRLALVGAACQLDGALQILARLGHVPDAPEHAAEDPVRAAGGARLAQALGQAQRLLGRVDGEHVVARLHVEPGRLLVEAHQLEAGRAVLEQVDALLVVLDGGAAVALVPVARADLAVQIGEALEVLLQAVVLEALLPHLDRGVHPAEPQRGVALLLAHSGQRLGVVAAGEIARRLEVRERLAVGVEGHRCVARGLEVVERLALDALELGGVEGGLAAQRGGAAVVLGEQGHHLVGAVPGALFHEAAHLEVLVRPDRLGQHPVGHVADEHVLERQLRLTRQAAALTGHHDVLLLERGERL